MADYCSCDDFERPSVYEETDVRSARMEHRCSECHRAILPGESYRHIWGVWPTIDGAATYRICARCMVLDEWIRAHIPCYCPVLGGMHEAVAQEIDYGLPDTAVLQPEFEALMADIRAQPKPQNSAGGV